MQSIRCLSRPAAQSSSCLMIKRLPTSTRPFEAHSPKPTIRLFSTSLTSTPSTTRSLLPSRTTHISGPATTATTIPSATSPSSATIPTSLGLSAVRLFSSSAALGAPRNTYNATHRVRKRRHGFLSRIKTRTGRMTLRRRRAKGRQNLSH